MFDSRRFGNGNHDVIDVSAVPYRFKDRVCETQCPDVLYCFLAGKMIDSEDLFGAGMMGQHEVDFQECCQVMAQRFFHDNPAASPATGQAGASQTGGDCADWL